MGRRDFIRLAGLGGGAAGWAATASGISAGVQPPGQPPVTEWSDADGWPTFRQYAASQLSRIALPLGGVGTGTVSLGGRGDLRDWELMNRPAKGFVPASGDVYPSLVLYCRDPSGRTITRLMEGPLEPTEYEGSHGSGVPNDNLPRLRDARFDSAYPFGRVRLGDPEIPLDLELRAFNPLVPADLEASSLPTAIFTVRITSRAGADLHAAVSFNLPNYIGVDGWSQERDWKGDLFPSGARGNRNVYREAAGVRGIFGTSKGVDPASAAWGTLALVTTTDGDLSWRTDWDRRQWGNAWLDFWDDFSQAGRLQERRLDHGDMPIASLAAACTLAPGETRELTFILAWHFPNRYSWTARSDPPGPEDWIGNHYCTRFADAWEAATHAARNLPEYYARTSDFARALYRSDLPAEIREAAGFTLTALRSQTSFRTPDGRFFGYEGCGDRQGCCHGSCTHVWNYEQATAYLFGELAQTMREVEFLHATDDKGLMSFRVHLPLARAREFGKAAADGQLGCIMKAYRDWQLSGDESFLRRIWPNVRRALEFCWIPGGWDADQDGVMEGCQHNTMDVEYYGPNPQMGFWYLGALRAAEEISRYLGDSEFADHCAGLFRRGRDWIGAYLFNGEYFQHLVKAPADRSHVASELLIGMGAADPTKPEFQLAGGCLVDQLVGQLMAHVCGLGYLADRDQLRQTLQSIRGYNHRSSLADHFNPMRTFALGDERGLLMAAYPGSRPENPFPYFAELMTGFEYTAAVGMLYEGMEADGLAVIGDVRARYDGRRRNPFDEAECGHHYARAMSVWAAILAWTGFRYSRVKGTLEIKPRRGRYFWSCGFGWGTLEVHPPADDACSIQLRVRGGDIRLNRLLVKDFGAVTLDPAITLRGAASETFVVPRIAPGTGSV